MPLDLVIANPELPEQRKFLGKPYPRLVRHCVDRMFHGGESPEVDGVEFGVGAVLVLLALPGAIGVALSGGESTGCYFRFCAVMSIRILRRVASL